MISMFIYKSIS